jgi:hypothetical protein
MSGWNDSALGSLRDEMGRLGVQYVELIPGKPPIGFVLANVTDLVLAARIHNPLLDGSLTTFAASAEEAEQALADEEADAAEQERADAAAATNVVSPPPEFWENARKIVRWQDSILSAVIVAPPWCPIDEVPPDLRPPGKLCIFDLTGEQRRQAVDFVFRGAEALRSFRAQSAGAAAAQHGAGVRDPAEPLAAAPGVPVSALLAGPGDLGAGPGLEGVGGGAGAHAADAPADDVTAFPAAAEAEPPASGRTRA